jgi:D-sedoheptulose 7-phosphate isomerase
MTSLSDAIDLNLVSLGDALPAFREEAHRLRDWGVDLAWILGHGGRLLVAGGGGSAAEAQHLAAELVGKRHDDRAPYSAIALNAGTSSLTAIGNEVGFEEVFARQVRTHGRHGDVLLLMSTSGSSPNLLAAAEAASEVGLRCWAFTGPTPNPLAKLATEVLAVPSDDPRVVQELHLVAVHLLCEYLEQG